MAAIGPMAGIAPETAPQPRLVRAAQEFEGQMMKELLTKMAEPGCLFGEDGNSGSGDALSEFAAEALGRGMSERGGFGIAHRIVGELSHSAMRDVSGKVTTNQHGNTVIGVPQ